MKVDFIRFFEGANLAIVGTLDIKDGKGRNVRGARDFFA